RAHGAPRGAGDRADPAGGRARLVTFGWQPRPLPLAPVGAFAEGASARRLADRLLRLSDEALGAIEGVAGEGGIALLGEIPWTDGLTWLGRDPAATALLLPTTRIPDRPVDLLQAELLRRVPDGSAPLVLLPAGLIAMGRARPVDRTWLQRWRDR
ncbi:MAG: hypothetical protein KC621_33060, partial [Myxococcales bacterium]|nr:hypothetical protein [Myxococcales bacterium]